MTKNFLPRPRRWKKWGKKYWFFKKNWVLGFAFGNFFNIGFLFDLYRRKLSVRIQELEDLLEQTRLRCTNLERTKSKLTAELKEVTIELENVSLKMRFRTFLTDHRWFWIQRYDKFKNKLILDFNLLQCQIIIQDLTKRNRQLENENAALQKRVDELSAENAQLRNDKHALEQEVYRLKVANAELAEKNANLERENKNLSGNIKTQ